MGMNLFFAAAGVLSACIFLLHTFVGGTQIARPLLEVEGLKDGPKYTQYYCWHLVTIVLFALAAAFIISAVYAQASELALLSSVLALAFAVLGIALAPAVKQSYRVLPQGWLFAPVAVLGFLGIIV